VALIVVVPTGLGGRNSSASLVAPFPGAVLHLRDLGKSGCSTTAFPTAWSFHLKTGLGNGSSILHSSECSGLGNGLLGASSAYAEEGFEVGVPFAVGTPGTHQVGANLQGVWKTSAGAFDASSSGTCPAGGTTWHSTFFHYYNGKHWWNKVPPGGLVLNRSTYYIDEPQVQATNSCSTYSSVTVGVLAWVWDLTNGSILRPTSTFGNDTRFVDQLTETLDRTEWSCYNATQWDFGHWKNLSRTCFSQNASTASGTLDLLTDALSPSTSFSNSGSATGTIWVNGSFNPSHRYVWILEFLGVLSVEVGGWKHGSAVASINLATHGNGIELNWIRIS
ncbi:MAG: hypothetical protein L3K09_02145, partial [Thermoplasmata archaeon]|nr:hypothetical protein [Thermoplasmata archaeon]